jgi:hypothetical protein
LDATLATLKMLASHSMAQIRRAISIEKSGADYPLLTTVTAHFTCGSEDLIPGFEPEPDDR